MHTTGDVGMALERLQGYFVGVPDARLTMAEASRLCGVDEHLCRQLVTVLLDVRFLCQDWDGSYQRRTPLFSDEPVAPSGLIRRLGSRYVGR